MSKLKVTPSGCPGPIPGSKVWRCDGTSCVYGPSQYASCKEAIAERGYTLRISSDLVEEAREAATLYEQNAQGQLQQVRQELLDEAQAHRATASTLQKQVELTQSEADAFAELYAEQMALREQTQAVSASLMQDIDTQCEHCATLLQETAALRDELQWYKMQVEGRHEETSAIDGSDGTSTDRDGGSHTGADTGTIE